MADPGLHVTVDPLICQGTGYCVRLSPETFELNGDKAVVLDPHPPDDLGDIIEEAATLCPTRAISY